MVLYQISTLKMRVRFPPGTFLLHIKLKNNREEAARILGIGERTLYRKMKEYELR